jgi:predicted phage baseplate assembly protein
MAAAAHTPLASAGAQWWPKVRFFKIAEIIERSLAGFALSGATTGLKLKRLDGQELSGQDRQPNFLVRTTVVYTRSELLDLIETSAVALVPEGQTFVNVWGFALGLRVGQAVAISGKTSDGHDVSELRVVTGIRRILDWTQLSLDQGLSHSYRRRTIAVNANVALATHGESRADVLGSGDASQAFQSFTLQQTPLTYVQATTPSGGRTTLEIRVNGLLWHERPSLYGWGPNERVYVTRRRDDGKVVVQFGDGKTGARLPTGTANVTASYRVGVGVAANVKAGSITTLLSRPLGVREARNPAPARGGSDPEGRDRARQNAPLTVRTIDRVVSLLDYEDFARSFGGVGKAQAIWLWDGRARVVHVTVAGDAGEVLDDDSPVMRNFLLALETFRDPLAEVRVDSYQPVSFSLQADMRSHPDYEREVVEASVRSALRATFSFDARAFGQSVTRSEVLAAMQRVPGVEAVDINELRAESISIDSNPPRLVARTARWNTASGNVDFAQLITLGERESAVSLAEMPA